MTELYLVCDHCGEETRLTHWYINNGLIYFPGTDVSCEHCNFERPIEGASYRAVLDSGEHSLVKRGLFKPAPKKEVPVK